MSITKATRIAVLERDDFTCQRCKVSILGQPYSIHHRKGRHCTNPDALPNLITVCGSGSSPACHFDIHSHPAESYDTGWMIRRLGSEDPTDVPLIDLYGRLFGLTDDGLVIDWSTHTQTGASA